MSSLADSVSSLVRTRADLHRRGAASGHGRQMHVAVDLLETAERASDPTEFYRVVHAVLASAMKVIARADDSSGIIGGACRRLLELHPRAAAAAGTPPGRLVDWMIGFQFAGDVDYFELDPVAYAPALGAKGLLAYRARLDVVRASLGPVQAGAESWSVPNRHERSVLDWNDRRLAVLDRDVDAIIRTHSRDGRVAVWLHDTARAFEEIGDHERAIDWARRAVDVPPPHQALAAGNFWCELLAKHRPGEVVEARLLLFRRWPSSTTAERVFRDAQPCWGDLQSEVMDTLARHPREAVLFTLLTLKDPRLTWERANTLALDDDSVWAEVVKAYEPIDPLAVLPVHRRLVERELVEADASNYRLAARRLARMRTLAAGTSAASWVDEYIAELRDTHRRRPRLQREFDRAALP